MAQTPLHERLRELVAMDDRGDPYAFVGRAEELAMLREVSLHLPPTGQPGRTVLIMGAPGAGKTALASRFVSELVSDTEKPTAVVELRSNQTRPDGFAFFMRQAAHFLGGEPPPNDPDAETHAETQFRGGAGAVASAVRSTGRTSGVLSNHDTCKDIAASLGRKGFRPYKRLIVFVDEVQALIPGGGAAEVLTELHKQRSLPIMTICAGLSNSEAALDDAGVSRPVADLTMRPGCLSADEARQSVRSALGELRTLGLEAGPDVVGLWADRIAVASDGWPKHLQTYMRAMFKTLATLHRPSLDRADLGQAIEAGHEARVAYYNARLKAGRTPPPIVAALHRAMAQGEVAHWDALNVIHGAAETLRISAPGVANTWDKQFGGDAQACFARLLHAGLVSVDANDICHSPIPSLSAHVVARDPDSEARRA